MADFGLIGGIAKGLDSGLRAYQDAVARREKREAEKAARDFEQERFSAELSTKGYEKDANSGRYKRTEEALRKEREDGIGGLLKQVGDDAPFMGAYGKRAMGLVSGQEQEYTPQDFKLPQQILDARLKTKAGGGEPKPTVFENEVDKKSAQDLVQYRTRKPSVLSDIEKLKEVEALLSSGKANVSGSLKGRLPFQDMTNPVGMDAQEKVAQVTQKDLRQILGGQFAEKEGEQLIRRAYNPLLDEATNLQRVRALREAMEQAVAERDSQLSWVEGEGRGTMRGYRGAPTQKTQQAPPPPQMTLPDGTVLTLDPKTGLYQ